MFSFLIFLAFILFKKSGGYYVYEDSTDSLIEIYTARQTNNCDGNMTQISRTIKSGGILRAPTTTTTTTERPTTIDPYTLNCPDTKWTKVRRDGYNWCWQIFFAHYPDRAGPVALCVQQGGQLTGFQTEAEKAAVGEAVRTHLVAKNIPIGAVWIGLERTPACQTSASGVCLTSQGFQWMDGYTTLSMSSINYWWTSYQPNNLGNDETAVVMRVYISPNPNSTQFDDVPTSYTNTNLDGQMVGLVCGKIAAKRS